MSTEALLLPPVAPEVLAEAVENLTGRLRKKLDAAIEACGSAGAVVEADGSVRVRFGEDAVVTLRPGPSGAVTAADQAVCGCLLAPRCLHRAAVLGAAPLAEAMDPLGPDSGALGALGPDSEALGGQGPGASVPLPDGPAAWADGPAAERAGGAGSANADTPGAGAAGAGSPGAGTAGAGSAGIGAAGPGSAGLAVAGAASGGAGTPGAGAAGAEWTGNGTPGPGAAGAGLADPGSAGLVVAGPGSAGLAVAGAASGGAGTAEAGAAGAASTGNGTPGPGSAGAGAAAPGSAGPGSAGPGSAGPGSAAPGPAGPGSAGPGSAGPGSAGVGVAGVGVAGAGVAGGPGGGGGAERLSAAQVRAAAGLWAVAAEALAAGVTAGGAVVQAELLRAAHTARLAGLPRAEAAALRVVRGLRAARQRSAAQRLGDLAEAFRDLLHTAGLLASGAGGPGLTGVARRAYASGGSLRVFGLCREPVLAATGYGGVVTHVLGDDGSRYSVSDVRPGGLARARGAGTASVALGGAVLDHAGLARGGLRIVGATVSADGRLGAGRGVRATPLRGAAWTEEPVAALFGRPAAEAVAASQGGEADGPGLLGCDVRVVGAAGGLLLVRELSPGREVRPQAPLLRLRPAHPHPELPHTANLRRLAEHPGLAVRVLGRPDPARAATLSPLAVGPVPDAPYTLRLPEEWLGRADLGYDRLQGSHFPAGDPAPGALESAEPGPDPLADSPLWRVRRLLETGVAGGRRAVAEAARGPEPLGARGALRRGGFAAAADLSAALAAEADRRPRDVFGRLTDGSPERYAWAWLAAATHLRVAERSLVVASWR